jgi:AAA+ ATPase superfamily predicted ATPase
LFHNRHREREVVREWLTAPRSELAIIYGRRGVGKSALLEQALADAGESSVFYRATRRTLPLQLAELTDAARRAFPDTFLPQRFESTTVFLDFLSHQAGERERRGRRDPVCVVLDELPYLADSDPGLLTVLQHWWDDNKRRPNLKMFLCGSYVSFMERQVLDSNSPLYNRRTGAMKLEPMDYSEAALFFPSYSARQRMEVYAILGGMPAYLEQFDPALPPEQNVLATALRRNTYLCEEPDWLLLEDLRKDALYGSILRAVAFGERKPSDIARAIGKDSAQDIAQQLATLLDMGLLAREVPVSDLRKPRSRTSLYSVADGYLAFWYRYVDPSRSLIARGLGGEVWERSIAPTFDEFVSKPTFERACRQYVWRARAAGAPPADLDFSEVGAWWGARDREIDLIALDAGGRVTLAGSCKWTNAPVDVSDYAALQRDLALSGLDAPDPQFVLFSRSGYTERMSELAASQSPSRLILVGLEEMYRV